MDWSSPAVSGGLAAVITPMVMFALMRLFPARPRAEFAEIPEDQLRRRNAWIEHVVGGVFFLGLFSAVGYYMTGADPNDPLGVAIGGAIAGLGPLLSVLLITGGSNARFNEYMYFCEIKHGIGRLGFTLIWAPVVFAGLASLIYLGHRAAI